MARRAGFLGAAFLMSLGAALLLAALPATAAALDVPPDVIALMDCADTASDPLRAEACGDGAIGAPRTIRSWSAAFLENRPGAPFESASEWIAPRLDASGAAIGTALTWQSPNGDLEFAGWDTDAELGETLLALGDGDLVFYAPRGAWYLLVDEMLTPLNGWAEQIVAEPMPLAHARALISADHFASIEACEGVEGCGGGGGDPVALAQGSAPGALPIVFGALAVAVIAAGVVIAVRSRSAAHARHEPRNPAHERESTEQAYRADGAGRDREA